MSGPNEIRVEFWMKPIPDRRFDYLATYESDEPNDSGGMIHGAGRTEREAVLDLIENHPRPDVFCPERGR